MKISQGKDKRWSASQMNHGTLQVADGETRKEARERLVHMLTCENCSCQFFDCNNIDEVGDQAVGPYTEIQCVDCGEIVAVDHG